MSGIDVLKIGGDLTQQLGKIISTSNSQQERVGKKSFVAVISHDPSVREQELSPAHPAD